MFGRGVAGIVLMIAASSAAFAERLSFEEALDLLAEDRWNFSCPESVSGNGRVGLIKKRGLVTADIKVKLEGMLGNLGEQTLLVPIGPAPSSFPLDLRSKSMCGSIFGFVGCFLVDKKDRAFRLYYFKGDGVFGFSGPDETEYCDFRRASDRS